MTSIRRKSRGVLLKYQLIILTLVILSLFVAWFTKYRPESAQAAPLTVQVEVPAPTSTPYVQHWLMLNDGDEAYLLRQPGCFLGWQELGDGYHFWLECDPVKGE